MTNEQARQWFLSASEEQRVRLLEVIKRENPEGYKWMARVLQKHSSDTRRLQR